MSSRSMHPRKLFSMLIESFPEEETKDLVDYMVELLRSRYDLDEHESYRIAEKYENSLRSHIDEYIDDCSRRNVVPKIVFSEYDTSRLVGRGFIYKTDSDETKRYKKKLRLVKEVKNSIESLSWDDFELLCRKIISSEPGFSSVRRRRRNGGIDFQGRYQVSATMRVSVAGQAKHYGRSRKIYPNLIRELAGSMRRGSWAFGIIMTTASFTAGARKVAGRENIDCLDGEQIAFKIVGREIGIVENNDILFDEPGFERWFHS